MTVTLSKEYKKLIERFPLRPIRTPDQFDAARKLMHELGNKGEVRTADESDYLIVLADLVAKYERTLPAVKAFIDEPVEPQELLEHLMAEHGLNQSELARQTGVDRAHVSSFLSGKRALSKDTALKLADRFNVSVELFLRGSGR